MIDLAEIKKKYWPHDSDEHRKRYFDHFYDEYDFRVFDEIKSYTNDDDLAFIRAPELMNICDISHKRSDNELEMTYSNAILFTIARRLDDIGLKDEVIGSLVKNFKKHYIKNITELEFYCYLINQWACVNIYFFNQNIAILRTNQAFQQISSEFDDNDSFTNISVNFNEVYENVFMIDIGKTDKVLYTLSQKEIDVMNNFKNENYDIKNIKIKYKNWTPKLVEIEWINENLEDYRKLDQMIEHWEITKKKYKRLSKVLKIKERKQL